MRIIGGSAGGRRLVAPAKGTRPTSDRVREALFSSLDAMCGDWHHLRVIDLYAGSGALGLEALSRGASEVLLVDHDRAARSAIEANVKAVSMPGARISGGSVRDVVAHPSAAAFDLAFLDPPYAVPIEEVRDVLRRMATGGWLAEGAIVVVEREARASDAPWPEGGWEAVRQRVYGDTALWYGRFLGRSSGES